MQQWERIAFERPDYVGLREKFTCVDMHCHSTYSDSHTQIRTLQRKAETLGIGLAIADHHHYLGSAELAKAKVFTVPAMEVTVAEGSHMLTYFYNQKDLKDFYLKHIEKAKNRNPYMMTKLDAEKLLKILQNYNHVVSIAHPYSPGFTGFYNNLAKGFHDLSVIKRVHAMEAINGQCTKTMNLNAIKSIYESGKAITGGSDAHAITEVGNVITCSKASTVDGFLKDVLRNRTLVVGQSTKIYRRIYPYSSTLKRHLRYIRPSINMRAMSAFGRKISQYAPKIRQK